MTHHPPNIAALRAQISRMEGFGRNHDRRRPTLPFGLPAVDQAIPGAAGLVLGALHEVAGTGADTEHAATSAVLTASLVARLTGPITWIVGQSVPYAPALAAVGLPTSRLLFVEAGSAILQTMEDCARHIGLAAVVAELPGAFDLTASRRLQLAAEDSDVTVFALRHSRKFDNPLLDAPNAALTRWRVSARPTPPVVPGEPAVPGVGRPRWLLELRRARGGQGRSWLVDGPDSQGRFAFVEPDEHRANGWPREIAGNRVAA